MKLTFGSVCTGIGGIDRGLEMCGLRVAYQCESDPFRRRVLQARFPDVPCYPDLNELPFLPVDVLAGGSPCQDLAAHGSGLGLDGDRSGLWWAFVRAVDRSEPPIVFFENVANVLRSRGGRDFAAIIGSLAGMGLDAVWGVFRASEAGLTHRRRRLFLLAYTSEGRRALKRSAHDDDGRQPQWHDAHRRGPSGDAPPGPDDLDALQAWIVEHGGPQPGVRRDLAGIPDRVDRVAALGDTAPPALVALAWRTLRSMVT